MEDTGAAQRPCALRRGVGDSERFIDTDRLPFPAVGQGVCVRADSFTEWRRHPLPRSISSRPIHDAPFI